MATGPRLQTGSTASGVNAAPGTGNTLTVPLTNMTTHSDGPITGLTSLNRKMVVYVNTYKSAGGGGSPVLSCTYNGVAMTKFGEISVNTGGAAYLVSAMFFLNQADLPGADNTPFDVVATSSTGTNFLSLAGAQFRNVNQGNPSVATNDNVATAVASVSAPHAIDYLSAFGYSASNDIAPYIFNNAQTELANFNNVLGNSSLAFSYVNVPSSISSDFTATGNAVAATTHGTGFTWPPVFDPNVYFQASVNATSTVTTAWTVIIPVGPTTIAATTTTAAALQRDRGYVSTVTAATTVTPLLVRSIKLQTLATQASTVTVQPFDRTARLVATVDPAAVISAKFNATRPIAATVNALAVVRPSFGNTFTETQYSPTPGDYVELYEIDTTVIGGTDVFRFIPHRFETPDVEVQWKGQTFIQFPVEVDGFEQSATGQAPPQPTLRVANVNKFILAAVLELGDIIGAKVTRWRTYARFLDNGETPDSNAHYAPDIYYIQQKTGHNREGFEFTLSSALDLPGIKLPRRQILKDQSSNDRNLYAPGVANVRFRGR